MSRATSGHPGLKNENGLWLGIESSFSTPSWWLNGPLIADERGQSWDFFALQQV